MASNTRVVSAIGTAVFDFTTTRRGTVTFFSNDLNIDFRLLFQAPGLLLNMHAGPILFAATASVGPGIRVTITPMAIGNAFPPPPLSLLQLQTDAILQSPSTSRFEGVRRVIRRLAS